MSTIYNELTQLGVLPVVTAYTVEGTVTLAKTLATNGIPGIEITCRTDCALDAIKAVKDADIDILLGAGTVTNAELLKEISEIGVDFAVSPGVTTSLLRAASKTNCLLLPGVSSASEIMQCMEHGIKHMKLFPAVSINALELLKAFHAPFPDVQFCPTGGVNMNNLIEFIQMPNVFCVGGSWMVPKKLIQNNEWNAISEICKECNTTLANIRGL